RKILLEASRQKSTLDMAKVFLKARPSDLAPDTPSTGEPRTGLSMGEHQAITTAKWGVTRAEQDELAAASHQNMANAYDEGFFTDLVTPY
ncbi:acetyl-CoA C-acyltransferase, partial [Escherichia coli]|nr:acetyl-CoA C-acyltransferase [Escherichia coli]